MAFGEVWCDVATMVPTRTDIQCRERWVNVLDPTVNRGPITDEELLQIRQALSDEVHSLPHQVPAYLKGVSGVKQHALGNLGCSTAPLARL